MKRKKLSLNRETVRTLTGSELEEVHGGKVIFHDITTNTCTTIIDTNPSLCIGAACNTGAMTDCC